MTAEQLLDILLRHSDLDAPILAETDSRWGALRCHPLPAVDLRDRFRGALIGGAIGDAMGRPNEGLWPNEARARHVREYQPWHGYREGPKGTITDDTQMTMWLAEAILAASHEPRAASREARERAEGQRGVGEEHAREQRRRGAEAHEGKKEPGARDQKSEDRGQKEARGQRSEHRDQREVAPDRQELGDYLIDPDDLIERFTREQIRGIGQATSQFLHNVKTTDKRWHEVGVPSAGNGTAMRAAPVGLVHLGDPYRIYRDSLLQSVVTHRDSMAITAAACQAYAVSRAAASTPGGLTSLESRLALCAALASLLEGLERPGYELRGGRGEPAEGQGSTGVGEHRTRRTSSLFRRIGTELPRYLEEGKAPFDDWYNGAYVLESLPCALWCFLASPDDFEQTLFTAVDAGHDADTVAAMACTVSGAYLGYAALPERLTADLEYHDRLIRLADGLYDLNRGLRGIDCG